MASASKPSRQTSQVTATPRWSCWASTPTTSPSSTAISPAPPATKSPNASSPPAAACRSSCSPLPTVSTTRPPASNSAPTTISRSRSNCGNSCSVSEHSTAGAPTTGPPDEGEETMDRDPGLSVRLKLTLSYAGFLMLASALLLAVVWVFLLRYVPDGVLIAYRFIPNRSDLLRAFAPKAAAMLAFLLVFG